MQHIGELYVCTFSEMDTEGYLCAQRVANKQTGWDEWMEMGKVAVWPYYFALTNDPYWDPNGVIGKPLGKVERGLVKASVQKVKLLTTEKK